MSSRLLVSALAVILAGCSPAAMFDGEGSNEQIAPDTLLVVDDAQPTIRLDQVAVGQPALAANRVPPQFETVDADPNCRMPRPGSAAKVAYVYTYGGGVKTPLQYIASGEDAAQISARIARTKEIAKSVAKEGSFEQMMLAGEASNFARGNAVEWLTRIDVLVTETEAPVFLVLTSYNAVMWNIQAAPGVKIDGVVVSAYEGGAIANGVDPRRTGFMGFDGSPNRSCRLKGRGQPVPVAVRIAGAKELNENFDERQYRERWDAEYRDGMKFFRADLPRQIGKRPDWILTHARGGAFKAVLVGPVPDQPFAQQPITRLQIPSYVAPFWGTRRAAFTYFGLE